MSGSSYSWNGIMDFIQGQKSCFENKEQEWLHERDQLQVSFVIARTKKL